MGQAPQSLANTWRVVGQSVQGASHLRGGTPNQDAIQWYPDSGVGPPLILSVSDGHGSPRNFRSDLGAQFAVAEATTLMRELLSAGQPDPARLSTIKRTAEERLPGEIARRWREAVTRHLKDHPITPEELETLEKRRDPKARRVLEKDPVIAYGATLLSVLITSGFILYLQLGDGDILTVADNGEVTRPMTRDPRLIANETTSLCMSEAWREVQIKFQALYGPHPALILLSSDGYANSFVNEAAFVKVGSDILDILRTDGLDVVERNLGGWLKDASTAGSGDDITMGILFPTAILDKPPAPPAPKPRKRRTSSQTAPPAKKPRPVENKDFAPPEAEAVAAVAVPEPAPPTAAVPKVAASAPEPAPPTDTLPEAAAPAPVEPAPAPAPPARAKIELIKNEESPREPSKKLPNIFYND